MRSKYGFVVGMASLLLAVSMAQAQLNHPPATPTVTEPAFDGRIVNPADVHMECSAFSDPDPGDTHACTDWEIWTVDPQERVWSALCVGTVPDLFHIHLGGGTFENSYAGRSVLEFDTAYRLRVRHKDSSGDPATEWSDYGVRLFQTAPATEIPPLIMDDVLDSAPPRWVATNGVNIILPGATPAPSVRVESGAGDGLVEIRGLDGVSNRLINFPPLGAHVPVRIVVSAGGLPGPLTLSETNLSFTDHSSLLHTVYLPAVVLPPGAQAFFWVSVSGATYVAQPGQTDPDFSQIARSAPVPFAVRQPGYVVEQVAGGFHLPVNIAFVPNPGNLPESPLFYVTELHGAIKLVKRNGAVSDYATNLLNFVPSTKILGDAQQGVTGVVVDPANGDLIVAMLFDVAPPIGPHAPKIVRMHSTDGGLTASTITTILAMPSELQSYSHQISNLTISPDGDLFVHMGDGFYTETALDLDSARGKILRMKLNGSAPSDNPFYNAADGISARDYVYALGFRNPFGGGWRQSDQQHYEVENGPSIDRFAKVVRGRNYLWDGTDESMFNWALYNWPVPHAATNIVFINPGTFNASSFPPDKVDHAFVAESGPTAATGPNYFGKRIAEFVLTPGGDLAAGPFSLIEYDGSGRGTVVALAAGPDGLYFSDFFKDYGEPLDRGSNILRVRYVGEAGFAADVRSGPLPLTVHFGDASSVLAPSSWQWDFGDGSTSTQRNPVHTYGAAGAYQVRLSVTGTGGLVSTDSPCFIRAGDLPHIAVLGATPPGSADDSLAAHLRSRGAVVDVYGCDAPTRPSGAELAQTTDLVIITTTTAPDSRSAEFRDLAVPLIIWDPRLLGYNRIALAGLGITSASETSISVVDRRHPLTLPLALSDLSVYQTAGPMNFAGGGINAAVRVLATRVGGPTLPAVLAADRGADLLDNVPAPAPRAFLFFSATGWLAATPAAIGILDRTVDWATQLEPVSITAHPLDAVVAAQRTAAFSVTADGSAPITYRWRRDGVPLNDDGRVTGVTTPTLTISNLSLADSGYYDALMANGCASATSNAAVLTVTPACPCDWDGVDGLNSQDFFEFLTDFFAGHADINHSGDTDSQDFFDFLTCFFGECH